VSTCSVVIAGLLEVVVAGLLEVVPVEALPEELLED